MEGEIDQQISDQYPGDSTVESLIEYGNIVRQEFSSEKEAEDFFNSYAKQKGFIVRKGKVRRVKRAGSIYYRTFLCFRSGYRKEKKMNINEHKRKPRSLTRCGCPVKFSMKLDNKTGRWYVHEFYDVHNHEMAAFS